MQGLKLKLVRFRFGDRTTTLGRLFADGAFFCYTLEDKVREDPNPATPENEAKVYGATAIPEGTYEIEISWSPKFKRQMIRVKDVPGFTGILMHGGNTHLDTLGCPLVGDELDGWAIKAGTASPAIKRLFNLVDSALKSGAKVTLTVTHEEAQP